MIDVFAASNKSDTTSFMMEMAESSIKYAKEIGATAASVSVSVKSKLWVMVRDGSVEMVQRTKDRRLEVTALVKDRMGSTVTSDFGSESIETSVRKARSIAELTEPSPYVGLPPLELMHVTHRDLDIWHPWQIDVAGAIELGRIIEAAGCSGGVSPSAEGTSLQTESILQVHANTLGFVGFERGTQHSISCTFLAQQGAEKQRGDWYVRVRDATDFPDFKTIGDNAAARAIAQLGARHLSTRECPVMFSPEAARSLIQHLLSAIRGEAVCRRASFLIDKVHEAIFPSFFYLHERPLLRKGLASALWDAEGVATYDSLIVEGGVLRRYVLDTYTARKLGLQTTANAGGVRNIILEPGSNDDPADLHDLKAMMGSGLLITGLIGQGVSTITGEYSRGVIGYWIENGQIAYPVQDVVIAGNLREMFRNILAVGSDVDRRSSIQNGSILIRNMVVAGK